jgi:hypothetical protein
VQNLLKSLFTFAFILCAITIIAGCSVGIRPAYYDLPPQDNNNYVYGEPAYSQYYNTASSEYRYNYNSTYDPWTMGTYYENYSPPQRSSSQTSSVSSNSPWTDDKRPVMQDRGTASSSESKAPKTDTASLRRDRTVQSENASNSTDASTSSIVDRKTKRNVRRDVPQVNQAQSSSQTEIQKKNTNTEPAKSNDSNKDEEDKNKKKKTATN